MLMAKKPFPPDLRKLEKTARSAARNAYAPYSHFRVGAAVRGASGRVYSGCNVENASYGLCNCAERSAIFAAISSGEKSITHLFVFTPTSTATTPCGACRQVINEFGPRALVHCICNSNERIVTTLDALLPRAFGHENLDDLPVAGGRRPANHPPK